MNSNWICVIALDGVVSEEKKKYNKSVDHTWLSDTWVANQDKLKEIITKTIMWVCIEIINEIFNGRGIMWKNEFRKAKGIEKNNILKKNNEKHYVVRLKKRWKNSYSRFPIRKHVNKILKINTLIINIGCSMHYWASFDLEKLIKRW